jgi:hypothetical protein
LNNLDITKGNYLIPVLRTVLLLGRKKAIKDGLLSKRIGRMGSRIDDRYIFLLAFQRIHLDFSCVQKGGHRMSLYESARVPFYCPKARDEIDPALA